MVANVIHGTKPCPWSDIQGAYDHVVRYRRGAGQAGRSINVGEAPTLLMARSVGGRRPREKRLAYEPEEGIPEAEPRSKFNGVLYGSARIGESIGKENVFPCLSKLVSV